ncbi:MAG TPA: hypothetical protein VF511_01205, partial [Chthoniobacterales bacterium]
MFANDLDRGVLALAQINFDDVSAPVSRRRNRSVLVVAQIDLHLAAFLSWAGRAVYFDLGAAAGRGVVAVEPPIA